MTPIWNTTGRLGVKAYNAALQRHILCCLVPAGLLIAVLIMRDGLPTWMIASIVALAVGLYTYYQYGFLQVMVRRLHDRSLSGAWLLLNPLFMIQAFGAGPYFGALVLGWSLPPSNAAITPTERYVSGGILLALIVVKFFSQEQMSHPGTWGPNRYGPDPQA